MKILLATDGTEHSEAAVDLISSLNFPADSQLKMISVVDMSIPLAIDAYAGYLPSTEEIEQTAKSNALKILEETKTKIDGLGLGLIISTEVLFGAPEIRIVETAEKMKADLIVVGSHGYNRWERLLLGSVSDSVVHHAPCSVLIVRNRQ
jgi:nucleotide-binding universal stress UspA family protein